MGVKRHSYPFSITIKLMRRANGLVNKDVQRAKKKEVKRSRGQG